MIVLKRINRHLHTGSAVLGMVLIWGIAQPGWSNTMQFLAFWVGVGLLIIGISGDLLRPSRRDTPHLLVLVMITLIGCVLRVVDLENQVHFFVDEMHFVDGVVYLREHPHTALLQPMNRIASFTWFYALLQTYSTALFGSTLTGLRIVSVLFGTLTIPAVYVLARRLDRRAALWAAFMLAVFPPHIHFSRLGLNNIADPFFGTLALAALLHAQRSHNLKTYALAGVLLGLTQYWYEGGKLIYPVLLLIVTLWPVLRRRDRAKLRAQLRGFLLLVGFALLVALPLIVARLQTRQPYGARFQNERVEIDMAELLTGTGFTPFARLIRDQAVPAFGHFFTEADASVFYYGGETALILPWMLPFFLLGGGIMWRRRQFSLLLLLLMVAGGNLLLKDPGWTARYVVTFPVLAVIVGVGLSAMINRARYVSRWMAWLVSIGSIVALSLQVPYYFGPHLATYNLQIRPYRDHQDIVWRVREMPTGTHVLLFTEEPTYFPHFQSLEAFWGLDLNEQFLHPLHLLNRGVRRLPTGAGLAIFMAPENRELRALLARSFDLPSPEMSPYNIPEEKQYMLYYLPFTAESGRDNGGQ